MLRGKALADATIAFIKANPDTWDQHLFFHPRGKTCFAGRAILIGLELESESQFRQYRPLTGADYMARKLLELDETDANTLFLLWTDDISVLEAAVERTYA